MPLVRWLEIFASAQTQIVHLPALHLQLLHRCLLCTFNPGFDGLITGSQAIALSKSEQLLIQIRCLLALVYRQLAVTRTQGKPVVVTRGFRGDNVNGQGKLSGHCLNDSQLLVVFFTENRGSS